MGEARGSVLITTAREQWLSHQGLPPNHPDRIAWEQKIEANQEQIYIEKARRFHEIYERLAPQFGYETRPDTKEFDPASPNGKLMVAVMKEI